MGSPPCNMTQLQALINSDTWTYKTALMTNIVLCMFSSLLLIPVIMLQFARSSVIPTRLMTWLFLYFCVSYLFLFTHSFIQSYHLISRFWMTGCELLLPASYCVRFRIFQSFRTVFAHIFCFGVTFDFSLYFFCRLYRKIYGSWLLALLMTSASVYAVYPSIEIELHSDELMVNCSSYESKSKTIQIYIYSRLLVLDVIGIISTTIWFIYQRCKSKDVILNLQVSDGHAFFNANKAFALLLPVYIASFISNGWHDFYSTWVAQDDQITAVQFVYTNTTPLCIVVNCCLLLYFFRILKKREPYQKHADTTSKLQSEKKSASWLRRHRKVNPNIVASHAWTSNPV